MARHNVLIKGMEMPKSCNACRLLEGDIDDGLCHAANRWLDDDEYWLWHQYPEGDVDTSKPSNCPLIEVPPLEVPPQGREHETTEEDWYRGEWRDEWDERREE